MRYLFRSLALVFSVLLGALTPILFGFHRWMIIVPRERLSIVNRKVRGVSGAASMFRRNDRSFAGGFGMVGSMAYAGGLVLLATLLVGALAIGAVYGPQLQAATPEHQVMALATTGLTAKLKDADGRIQEKHKQVDAILTAAGNDVDFSKPEVLTLAGAKTSAEVVEKLRSTNTELEALVKEREGLQELAGIEEANRRRKSAIPYVPMPDGGGNNGDREERKARKGFGQVIVESEAFTNYKKNKQPSESEIKDFGIHEMKTLFETGAGWAPSSPRSDIMIPKAIRPVQLLDIIPVSPMDQAALPYMEETTLTNAAAERAEGGAYVESTFALTERSETARSIGTSVPVTDEQLEDVPATAGYLDSRLRFGVLQRLDNQIILGNGTPPNLQGIKTKSGVQTQSGSGLTKMDTLFKAMTKVRVTGRAIPSAHVIHPTDWEEIRLTKTVDGIYIFGSPSEAIADRLWGLPVIQYDADSAGISYTGDFVNFIQLFQRRGLEVAVGYVGTQFTEGKKTIRAGMRVALAIYRAAAFCKNTF